MKAKAQQTNFLSWTGTIDSLWNNPGNWSTGRIPSVSDDVIISKGSQSVHVNCEASCKNLEIGRGSQLIIQNEGKLTIAGNLINSGFFLTKIGVVVFSGKSRQEISSANPLVFHTLEINNSSQAGVYAGCKVSVLNELLLKNGVFEISDTLMILNDVAGAIGLSSENSYVAGRLQRKIRNSADQVYFFPVGAKTYNGYFPVQIDDHLLEGTSRLTISFEPLERYNKSQLNVRDNEISYDYVAQEGMWVCSPDVEPSSGWFDLKLWISNISGLVDNQFGILKRPVGTGPDAWVANFGDMNVFGGEGRMFSHGYALRKYCISFSEYVVAGGGEAIPIELLGFIAEVEKGVVNLSWSTATETNNEYFVIEKSNGTDFTEVAKINGGGSSTVKKNYAAVDEKPFSGLSYYRLRQVDYNGEYKFSKVVAVNNVKTGNQMVIFPNPSERVFKIKFLNAIDKAEVTIYNQHGSASYTKTFLNLGVNPAIELNLQDVLLPGIYYLQVNSGSGDLAIQQIVID